MTEQKYVVKMMVLVETEDLYGVDERIREALGEECALVQYDDTYVSWKQAALEEIKSGY